MREIITDYKKMSRWAVRRRYYESCAIQEKKKNKKKQMKIANLLRKICLFVKMTLR